MTVKEIVKDYLEKNGFDGLCGENCGCGIDDFMPCGLWANDSTVIGCNPAYKHLVKNGELNDIAYSTEKPEIQNEK